MTKEDDFKEWIKTSENDLIVARVTSQLPKPQNILSSERTCPFHKWRKIYV